MCAKGLDSFKIREEVSKIEYKLNNIEIGIDRNEN